MSHTYFTDLPDREIICKGKPYLQFSGTSYLGMGSHPEFRQMLISGLLKHGPNHGSSRNSNVQLPIYDAFESHFAAGSGAAEAALLSSGYMAGQLALNTLRPLVDLTWTAPETHPAITFGSQQASGDSHSQWQKKCVAKSHELMGQKILILSNAVNPLLPEIYNFKWLKKLSPANKYFLLIDDSHAFGLLGEGVFGTYGQWKNLPVELMVCGSLGKALALPAGIILGSQPMISEVRKNAIYRTSSPPAPAFLEAFMKGRDIYRRQQEKLNKNLHYMFSALEGMEGFKFLPDYPVVSFEAASWVERLHQEGFALSSFPYPLPGSPPVNRIVLSAWHLLSDLEKLVKALKILHNG